MTREPVVIERAATPYVAITAKVRMDKIGAVVPPLTRRCSPGPMDATARLLKWADDQGLNWDVSPSSDGERWGCRLEIYHDEPGQDMNEWETELAFRLAD